MIGHQPSVCQGDSEEEGVEEAVPGVDDGIPGLGIVLGLHLVFVEVGLHGGEGVRVCV